MCSQWLPCNWLASVQWHAFLSFSKSRVTGLYDEPACSACSFMQNTPDSDQQTQYVHSCCCLHPAGMEARKDATDAVCLTLGTAVLACCLYCSYSRCTKAALPGHNGRRLLVSPCLFEDALLGLCQAQPFQHAGTLWRDVHRAGLFHSQGGHIPQVCKRPCSFLCHQPHDSTSP